MTKRMAEAEAQEVYEKAMSDLQREWQWMRLLLLRMPYGMWMQWVEGPYFAVGGIAELEYLRDLREQQKEQKLEEQGR